MFPRKYISDIWGFGLFWKIMDRSGPSWIIRTILDCFYLFWMFLWYACNSIIPLFLLHIFFSSFSLCICTYSKVLTMVAATHLAATTCLITSVRLPKLLCAESFVQCFFRRFFHISLHCATWSAPLNPSFIAPFNSPCSVPSFVAPCNTPVVFLAVLLACNCSSTANCNC